MQVFHGSRSRMAARGILTRLLSRGVSALALVTALAAPPAHAISTSYSITDLGALTGADDTDSVAYAINNSGAVVGVSGIFQSSLYLPDGYFSPRHAFLWQPTASNATTGTLKDLGGIFGYLCGNPAIRFDTWATDINSGGQVVGDSWAPDPTVYTGVGTCPPSAYHPALFGAGFATDLSLMPGFPSSHSNYATGINDAGQVVGQYQSDIFQSGVWVWDTQVHDLGNLPNLPICTTEKINNKGQIVGTCSSASLYASSHAFLHSGTAPLTSADDIGTPGLGGTYSSAFGLNQDGVVVGTAQVPAGAMHAFRYDIGRMTDLGTLDPADASLNSGATAVNKAQDAVGYSGTATGQHAVFWKKWGTVLDLNSVIDSGLGWELQIANGINDAGQIVGMGLLNGQRHAFLLNRCGNAGGDSDGDGLCDDWERFGVTVTDETGHTVGFLNLPAMGANPNHKDIFVQTDYMVAADHSHQPKKEAMDAVIAAFSKAPVSNPDGKDGITLHIDCGPDCTMDPVTGVSWGGFSKAQGLDHVDMLSSAVGADGGFSWSAFDLLQDANFPPERAPAFHYAIFAHDLGQPFINPDGSGDGTSGISRAVTASDFIISLGSGSNSTGTVLEQAGTFMHELGHNLSLNHGGLDDINFKPNYLSVMNYLFQTHGLLQNGAHGLLNYSLFDLPNLDEHHLNENLGLNGGTAVNTYGTNYFCPGVYPPDGDLAEAPKVNAPINWNCDILSTDTDIEANINGDKITTPGPDQGNDFLGTLTSTTDWDRLVFTGGSLGNLGQKRLLPVTTPSPREMTLTMAGHIPHPFDVAVAGPGITRVLSGATLISSFTVTNRGKLADTYDISAATASAWWDRSGIPASLALPAGASARIDVPVMVPGPGAAGATGEITLKATSQQHPLIRDSATAQLIVGNVAGLKVAPNVVGLPQTAATAAIATAGLTLGSLTTQHSSTVPADIVISQTPVPRTVVMPGSPVNLVVSTGPVIVAAPDVVGQSQTAAAAALTAAGLNLGTVTRQGSATVPAGMVISQSPAALAPVALGLAVNVTVSLGSALVRIPDAVRWPLAETIRILNEYGLVVGTVTRTNSLNIPKECIVALDPQAGLTVPPGTVINLIVSNGLGPVHVGNYVGSTKADAIKFTSGSGLVPDLVTYQLSATVPKGSVIAQSLRAGSIQDPGTTINLVISSGSVPASVPNIVGLDYVAADAVLRGAGLAIDRYPVARHSDTAPINAILAQTPAPGTPVPADSTVNLEVSQGPAFVTVPPIDNQNFDGAYQILSALGLATAAPIRNNYPYSATVPYSIILAEDPVSGSTVAGGSAVRITTSGGLPFPMPNYVGQPYVFDPGVAASQWTFQGHDYSLTVPQGIVIDQDPAAGTLIGKGYLRLLTLSYGPPASLTTPDVVGQLQGKAAAAISAVQLKIGEVSLQFSAILPEGTVISQSPAAGAPVGADLAVSLVVSTIAPTNTISTVAGNLRRTLQFPWSVYQDSYNIPATSADIGMPLGLAFAQDGSLLISEQVSVLRVDPAGILTLLAGDVTATGTHFWGDGLGGPAPQAVNSSSGALAVTPDGNLYLASSGFLNRVGSDGIMTVAAGRNSYTLTGASLPQLSSGGGWRGTAVAGDGGPASQAIISPKGLAAGPDGSIYLSDWATNTVRCIDPTGTINRFAGDGTPDGISGAFTFFFHPFGGDGGPALQAKLDLPTALAVGSDGSVYIMDSGNNMVRRVDPAGVITTIAGNGKAGYSGDGGPATQASFNLAGTYANGLAVDKDGTLYIADSGNNVIRRVGLDGTVCTVVGNGTPGFSGGTSPQYTNGGFVGDGGTPLQAQLSGPEGIALGPDGALYIADMADSSVRRVTPPFHCPSATAPVVPNVVGLGHTAAAAAIAAAGLIPGSMTTQPSETIPVGAIMAQVPAAGTRVPLGSALNLVMSSGSEPVAVPNLVGQTQSAAAAAIAAAGLAPGRVTRQSSATAPVDSAIGQYPRAGMLVAPGSPVYLTVSSGVVTCALKGNLNGDTTVDVFDALLTLQYAVGLIEHTPGNDAKYQACADVAPLDGSGKPKGDGAVNVFDAVGILRHAVGLDPW